MTSVPVLRAAAILLATGLAATPQSLIDAQRESKNASAPVGAGRLDQAIALYKKLAAEFPNQPPFGVDLANALFKAGTISTSALDICVGGGTS